MDDNVISDSGWVTFEATVSDPDGAGDIADVLLSDDQGTAYGGFQRFSETVYTLRTNWSAMEDRRAIVFGRGVAYSRTFVATAIDRASARATAQVSPGFTCGPDGAACATGGCENVVNSLTNCGSCGNACADVLPQLGGRTCNMGRCQGELNHVPQQASCNTICGSRGLQCVQAWGHYSGDTCPDGMECSEVPPSTSALCSGGSFTDMYCVCSAP